MNCLWRWNNYERQLIEAAHGSRRPNSWIFIKIAARHPPYGNVCKSTSLFIIRMIADSYAFITGPRFVKRGRRGLLSILLGLGRPLISQF